MHPNNSASERNPLDITSWLHYLLANRHPFGVGTVLATDSSSSALRTGRVGHVDHFTGLAIPVNLGGPQDGYHTALKKVLHRCLDEGI